MRVLTDKDTQLFRWLFAKTASYEGRLIRWISKTGDGHLYLVIGGLLWAFEPQHGSLFMYTALLAYSLEVPVYVVLKKAFKRTRPCDLMTHLRAHVKPSDKFSLPSGHTAAAFLMASLLSWFYPIVAVPVFIWASMVGLSRVLLGVHYPGDILAGALLGLTISLLSITMLH